MRHASLKHSAEVSGLFHVTEVDRSQARLTRSGAVGNQTIEMVLPRPELGRSSEALQAGDVLRLVAGQRRATVCWRTSDRHHALFVTNQCNSRCLMCSQPPTPQADGWLFDEAMEIVALADVAPTAVGITGGEPTLHPQQLRALIDFIHKRWPDTQIEVLTNARRLADEQVASLLLHDLPAGQMNWLVPLYGANDETHDFVVQSPGAFDETLGGLLNLQNHRQRIQLRTVLVRPVIESLPAWAEFVGRNLPFVDAVALMATEPIGFALANEHVSLVDISTCIDALTAAADSLSAYRLRPVLMNMPLCKLPQRLRPLAAMSISDWKNDYAPECTDCALRPNCAGFFVWDKTSIYRTGLKPVRVAQGGLNV